MRINTNIAGFYYLDRYTTVFPENYFERPAAPATPVAPEAAKPDETTSEYSGSINIDYVNERLSFLRNIMSKYSLQDPMALMALQDIKNEIHSLEDILWLHFVKNSQNVTLRAHQLPVIY